jgi:pilus assembly protein CpaB
VLVSTERSEGAGRTFVALEDVELLRLRGGAGTGGFAQDAEGGDAGATALATLRVTLRQAVYLTAAENFGREVRLLVRPAGDRGRSQGATTTEGEL